MASLVHVGGGAKIYRSDGCGTILKIDDFAKVTLITGASEIGQGSETVLAQIAAEELGLPGATYFLEGGYDIDALAEVVLGVHEGFFGRTLDYKFTDVEDPQGMGSDIVDRVIDVHSDYWDL